ncbi:MAG: helix-turn-helix domain-containing protein [Lentisphaeria bacterium]|nr:helix-turn-helix domain-containing protein [Lentisphaeria bacterium]
MKTHPTDKELAAEVAYFTEHLDELSVKQQAERKAYFENPDNAGRIAFVQQRMAIAEQLYKARKKAGLTQAEVASRMQVSQPLVARLERGRGNISCDTLLKYAAACGCLLSITIA